MTSKELKNLAKERGLPAYNNLNLTSLVRIHEEYDEAVKKSSEEEEEQISEDRTEEIKEFKLLLPNGSDFIIPIQKDGMVNATLLCQAGGKKFNDYERSKQNKAFLDAVITATVIPETQIIKTIQGGHYKFQGTWVHRLVAIDLARWVYPFLCSPDDQMDGRAIYDGQGRTETPSKSHHKPLRDGYRGRRIRDEA